MDGIEKIKELLNTPKNIVITSHRNPDGDAIGSSMALKLFLEKKGHLVYVIVPSEYPTTFEYIKDVEQVIIYDLDPEKSKSVMDFADVVFFLDFNGLDRIDKLGKLIDLDKVTKIMIDHHMYPEGFCDFMLSDETASSTCELVFDFIQYLEETDKIDVEIGECLYTGIITDTGSFKFSTSAKLFRIVASLKEIGVDDRKLQNFIFNSMAVKNLKLLAHCLYNRMEILEGFQTGIIYLTKQDYKDFDIKRGDTEGIVNYLLMLKKIKLAAFITEQPTIVKISLRSKGNLSVQEIARKHFNGGGHKNASGGAAYASLDSVITRFKRILPNYINQIN